MDQRYVVYSMASHNALASGATVEGAIKTSIGVHGSDTDFLIVFQTTDQAPLDRYDAARWPLDAQVVWRGADPLAQEFRN